jgi:peptidoglycan/LPS O-acetylase OafA/YrhL
MIFYLFFPLLFFIVKKHKKILFLLLIISLIIFAISIFNNEDLWYTSLKKAMYSFLLGFTLFKLKDINISKILLKILSIINILIYILLPIIIHLFELKYLFELDIILLPILI